MNFINNGTDERILKSLPTENISEDLIKAMNRQGLVQKEVQVKGKNGQIFTRKQWVRAGETQKQTNSRSQKTQNETTSPIKATNFEGKELERFKNVEDLCNKVEENPRKESYEFQNKNILSTKSSIAAESLIEDISHSENRERTNKKLRELCDALNISKNGAQITMDKNRTLVCTTSDGVSKKIFNVDKGEPNYLEQDSDTDLGNFISSRGQSFSDEFLYEERRKIAFNSDGTPKVHFMSPLSIKNFNLARTKTSKTTPIGTYISYEGDIDDNGTTRMVFLDKKSGDYILVGEDIEEKKEESKESKFKKYKTPQTKKEQAKILEEWEFEEDKGEWTAAYWDIGVKWNENKQIGAWVGDDNIEFIDSWENLQSVVEANIAVDDDTPKTTEKKKDIKSDNSSKKQKSPVSKEKQEEQAKMLKKWKFKTKKDTGEWTANYNDTRIKWDENRQIGVYVDEEDFELVYNWEDLKEVISMFEEN